ncbi:MAG: TIGR02147 family protein [Pseudobdellovibrio sp.]
MAYISVYDYEDYKNFLNKWIELTPNKGRGQRIKLAQAIRCQTPFITHVLTGDYHFSSEQAEACSRWLGLSPADAEYFVLLVLKQRASNRETQSFFNRQIIKLREQENILKKRLKIKEGLNAEDQLQYYSNWQYAAVHMALLNPKLQDVDSLAHFFQMSRTRVMQILDFLSGVNLIEAANEKIKVKSAMIHLEKASPLLPIHHVNWRLKSIEVIKENLGSNLHYSSTISLSYEDYDWVKSKLSLLLEELVDRVKKSPDETLAALSFDWYKL